MVKTDLLVLGVEIAHVSRAHGHKSEREARPSGIHQLEIDQRRQKLLQRIDVIQGGALDPERGIDAANEGRVGIVKTRYAHQQRRELVPRFEPLVGKVRPELPQPFDPALDRISGDDDAVDGADRRADHPIRLDAGVVQGLVSAGLINPWRTTALQDQHHLAGKLAAI